MSVIWSRKHLCKKLRFINIFDCLFDLVQTTLMQRVEILKRVWFVKYISNKYLKTLDTYSRIYGICGPESKGSMSIIVLLYKMTGFGNLSF